MNFIYPDTRLQDYMICPREVMNREDLPEGAKILYMYLLERARLSMQDPKWRDEGGRAYVVYPIASLCRTLHKGETAVRLSLKQLERTDLIKRIHRGVGRPDRIFVKIPQGKSGCRDPLLLGRPSENRGPECRKTAAQTVGKPVCNYINSSYKDYTYLEGESL